MHLFWNINQEGLQHAKCCKEERHLFVDFFLTATELTVMLATAFPLFKGNGMAGVTDPTAKGTALAQERRAQLEPDVCSPFNYLLPVESFSWSCVKGFFASRVERLGIRANIGLQQSPKKKGKDIHEGVGMTASTPQNKARTFLTAHSNEKQQISREEPIITITLFTVSQFTVWYVNAE